MSGKTNNRPKLILRSKESNNWYSIVYQSLQFFLFSMIPICLICSLVDVNRISFFIVIGIIFFGCVLLGFLKEMQKIQNVMIGIGIVDVLYMIFFVGIHSFVQGIIFLLNQTILRINIKFHKMFDLLASSEIDQFIVNHTFIILSIFCFLLSSYLLLRKCNKELIVIGVLTSIFTALFLKQTTFFFVLLILSGCSLWVKYEDSGLYAIKLHWFANMAIVIFVLTIATKNQITPIMKQVREIAYEKRQKLRYGEDTLPEGDLYKAQNLGQGKRETLIVTSNQIKSQYLTGFVGGVYQNGKWKPLSSDAYAYEYHGMISWLATQKFFVPEQYAMYNKVGNEEIGANKITIENKHANRKYMYMPYSVKVSEKSAVKLVRDIGYQSKSFWGARTYSYKEYSSNTPSEILNISSWVKETKVANQKQFLNAESVYRNFVYNKYCLVDEDIKEYCQSLFWDDVKKSEKETVYSCVKRVREIMEKNFHYKKKKNESGESDPLRRFLFYDNTGNAAYYTSAAVMALRSNGIPARYAEGYFLSEKEALEANGKKVILHDNNAHAWVEVYMDTIGWIPIDFTPGYYYDTYTLLDMVKTPTDVLHTAQLNQQSSSETNHLLKDDENVEDTNEALKHPFYGFTIQTFWGVIALIFVFLTVILLFLEGRRSISLSRVRKHYEASNREEQINILCQKIIEALAGIGIVANFGWEIEETEKLIRKQIPMVREGDYIRISELVSKFIYGKQMLLPYEQRILEQFLEKITNKNTKLDWKKLLKTRYFYSQVKWEE